MAFGEPINPGTPEIPVAFPNRIGPRDAMAMTLAEYLSKAEFRVYGSEDLDTPFKLNNVLDHFPGPNEELNYPCCSIIDATDTEYEDSGFTPEAIEDTFGVFDKMVGLCGDGPATCLWRDSTVRQEFQVDFFTDMEADRRAIAAAIPAIFSPHEGRYGVILEGPEIYYSRSARFTLVANRTEDTSESAYTNERRLRCVVIGNIASVSLRRASTMVVSVRTEAVDPNDSTNEEEYESDY